MVLQPFVFIVWRNCNQIYWFGFLFLIGHFKIWFARAFSKFVFWTIFFSGLVLNNRLCYVTICCCLFRINIYFILLLFFAKIKWCHFWVKPLSFILQVAWKRVSWQTYLADLLIILLIYQFKVFEWFLKKLQTLTCWYQFLGLLAFWQYLLRRRWWKLIGILFIHIIFVVRLICKQSFFVFIKNFTIWYRRILRLIDLSKIGSF